MKLSADECDATEVGIWAFCKLR